MKKNTFLLLLLAALTLPSCGSDLGEAVESTTALSETVIRETETSFNETTSAETESPSESETEADITSSDVVPETEFVPETDGIAEAPCRLLSFTVSKTKNRNMCETLTGVISDNTVTLTVNAPTDTFSLKNAVVDTETDGVSVSLSSNDLTSENCTCTVTDEHGLTRTYTILLNHAAHTIPVISIDTTDGTGIVSKEEYIDAVIRIDTTGVTAEYLPEGFSSIESTEVQIRGRGNSTWNWDKKPYKLKFPEKTEVLGMDKAKKWILLSNYADYSLIRNYTAMEASKVLSDDLCPLSQYPVNLFINGEYQGIYTIGEDHEVKSGRIDLTEDNGTADTSFLLEIGGYDEDDIWGTTAFTAGLVRYCSIEYPEEDALTEEQAAFIIDYCLKADQAIRELNGYEEFLDVDSAIDWFISTELFYNLESCFRRSCFITKEPGGKLRLGPVWDYDLALGNLYNDFGQYESWACLSQSNGYIEDNWFCCLLNDPAFMDRLKARWNEKKDDLLSTALSAIDQMGELLTPSARYNFEIWDTLGTRAVSPQPLSITQLKTYEDNIQYIRDFVSNRWNWMDSILGN